LQDSRADPYRWQYAARLLSGCRYLRIAEYQLSALDDEVKKYKFIRTPTKRMWRRRSGGCCSSTGAPTLLRRLPNQFDTFGMICMKTIRVMITAAGVAILLSSPALTGCKRQAVERTSVEHQEDDQLAEQVKATFKNSPSFKFPDVQVAAFKGTVQLSGFVLSDEQKQAAENLAKGVPGVVTVENKISRKP
jgi:hyperosmotically inducible periplasmic protein